MNSYLRATPPELLTIGELTERSMNENRKKEIEGIIEKLADISKQIGQIRMADAIARTKRDTPLQVCHDSLTETICLLQAAIKVG